MGKVLFRQDVKGGREQERKGGERERKQVTVIITVCVPKSTENDDYRSRNLQRNL